MFENEGNQKKNKNPGVITSIEYSGRGPYRDCVAKIIIKMKYTKDLFEKLRPDVSVATSGRVCCYIGT